MLRPAAPIREQDCPFCGNKLPANALYCEACGTDLARAAATFSTGVKPMKKLPRTHKLARAAKPVAAVAGAVALVVGLGSVPAVSARVPMLGALYASTVGWSQGLLGRRPVQSVAAVGILVFVRSYPTAAQVHVNDQPAGTTPLSVELQPGNYTLTISREGYPSAMRHIVVEDIPVTVEVNLLGVQAPSPQVEVQQAPQPAPPQPVRPRPLLAVGTAAPALSLKDRLGVLHTPALSGPRKTALLFVWRLDEETQQTIRELDARVRRAPTRFTGMVVMMTPDRTRIRSFLLGTQMKIPFLIGGPELVRPYQLTPNLNVLYLVSERGTIERGQSGTIWPAAFIQ
ncbi:MAG TPA: PEGA domain-containing protein [bacterium]|nr:PEGA domain-containing protein [bacterium]